MEDNNQVPDQQNIEHSPQTPVPPKKSILPIPLIILSVLVVTIAIVGVYMLILRKNQSADQSSRQTLPVSPTTTQLPQTKSQELPKLAYIETFGIGIPEDEDKNPDLGGVFVLNSDGTDKKLLYQFNLADLVDLNYSPIYSPNTHEIIENTQKGIVAIDTITSQARNLYTANNTLVDGLKSVVLSDDKNSIYITSYHVDHGVVIENLKKYKVSLTDRNSPPQEISSYTFPQQPYFDSRTGKEVEVNFKGSTSEFIVTDTKSNTKKSYIYNKLDRIKGLFTANNYFYFESISDRKHLSSINQLNLDTGEFSSPSSMPELSQRLANTNLALEFKGISPDGTYYVYTVNNWTPRSHYGKTYLYNTLTKQETELSMVTDGFIKWSSDSKFILFNYFNGAKPGAYIYNIDSKKLEHVNIRPSNNYIILR